MRFLRIIGAVVGCLLTSAAWAKESIPFQFSEGLIWVKVNSSGTMLNFVLDSGAGSSALSMSTAHKISAKLGGSVPVLGAGGAATAYRVDGFQGTLGSFTLKKSLIALDLNAICAACGKRIDGIVGQDFFRGRIVRIDFRNHRLDVLDSTEVSRSANALPLRYKGDTMCVPVGVNGAKPQWTRLDTGCTSALEWAASDSTTRKAFSGASVSLTKGTRQCCQASADVQLGGLTLHSVKAGLHSQQLFAGEAGLLGTGVLSRFRVTINARSMKLFLE